MPFAGYQDFDACVAANSDKADPKAYCAVIQRRVEKRAELVAEITKHFPGQHDQKSHGNWARGPQTPRTDADRILLDSLQSFGEFNSPRHTLVAERGRFYVAPTPEENERRLDQLEITRGEAKQCFINAGGEVALWSRKDLIYVEGFALSSSVPFPVHHAWIVTPEGEVIDPTWHEGTGLAPGAAYYGIPFDTSWLRRHMVRTETWGVFQGGEAEFQLHEDWPEDAIAR